jgi:hypothetical protein
VYFLLNYGTRADMSQKSVSHSLTAKYEHYAFVIFLKQNCDLFHAAPPFVSPSTFTGQFLRKAGI